MTRHMLSLRNPTLGLAIGAAVLAIAIFAVDTMTPLDIAVPVLYVLVVLMAAGFCTARGVMLVAAGCVALTVLSAILTPGFEWLTVKVPNTLLCILAIGLTTVLALQGQSAAATLRERASLLDLTHDAVFSRDMNDIITYWNRGAEELLGWTAGEAVGKRAHKLLEVTFLSPADEIQAELLRTGRWEGEKTCKKRDGTQVVLATRWSLQRNEQGLPTTILETNNDITESKLTQENLRQAEEELARVNRVMLMSELTASIAHEVNQPIAGVVANASACVRWLAAQPPCMDEAREALGRILRDANRAGAVVGRIRAMIKKAPPRSDCVDINAAILEVFAMVDGEMQRSGVRPRTRLSSDLPMAAADRVQVQQVILNLIVNAMEAMSGVGDRPRELVVSSGEDDSNDLFVEVRDSGSGLDPANLDRLFQSFYTTKPDGMGMGLAISRSIVEAHGGRLWAGPNEPHGAVFRFTLPVADESPADLATSPS